MSIRDEIMALKESERLIEYETFEPVGQVRPIFLTPDVNETVKNPNLSEVTQMMHVQADLTNFLSGGMISTAFGKGPKTNFRRLAPYKKGKPPFAWEMRTISPPGQRLFGFFADVDIFIGVSLVCRAALPTDAEFRQEIKAANATWRGLFPMREPVQSRKIANYISCNVSHQK